MGAIGEDIPARVWHFGRAVLDERSLELTFDGQPARLERKSLEVLLHLLHHAGEVVTKDELFDAVWPGRVLSETVLAKCVSRIRAALHDKPQELIKTAHGFGYRLVAEVRVDVQDAQAPPALQLESGDRPPLRPDWRLESRLDSGGFGDVWLVRHASTDDVRVFKFARDAGSLRSLKREITLNRLLQDGPGGAARMVEILDWNLEEPPFFIESEYVAGGNLEQWARSQGGIDQVPLAQRIDLLAQIAEALSYAHTLGVLHKDLKPANVLIDSGGAEPFVKLCDFGSGVLLDGRLEHIGITRLGFTRSVVLDDSTGTPLYLAPEILAGQPATARADIYAFGVLLYQVLAGSFRKPLAAGWEADIEDELLREDIGRAAAGDVNRRLGDAERLAAGLRRLDIRRKRRQQEREEAARAEEATRMREELERLRQVDEARRQAEAAAQTTQAVCDFMNDELLGGVRWSDDPDRARFLNQELDRAAALVGERLGSHAAAAAEVHMVLGVRYFELNRLVQARREWEAAQGMLEQLHGSDAIETLPARSLTAMACFFQGEFATALQLFQVNQSIFKSSQWAGAELLRLDEQYWMACCHEHLGQPLVAIEQLDDVLARVPDAHDFDERAEALYLRYYSFSQTSGAPARRVLVSLTKQDYGDLRRKLGQFDQALDLLRACDDGGEDLGFTAWQRATVSLSMAEIHAQTGAFDAAAQLIAAAREVYETTFGPEHSAMALVYLREGQLALERGRASAAVDCLRRAWQLWPAAPRESTAQHTDTQRIPEILGRALLASGQLSEAAATFRQVLDARENAFGPDNLWNLPARLGLAEAVLGSDPDRAVALLAPVEAMIEDRLPAGCLQRGDIARLRGLIADRLGDTETARRWWQTALASDRQRLDPDHPRIRDLEARLQ